MTKKKYSLKQFAVSTAFAVFLSFLSGFLMLWILNEKLEGSLQTITLILGLTLYVKNRKQDKYTELLNSILISIIYTLLTAKFYEELHPKSEDGVKRIGSFIVISLNYYYLYLTGILFSIFNLTRRTLTSS